MADRATYRSTSLFVNGNALYRVQAFGSTTTLNREDIFEMGNKGVVKVIDDNLSVEGTIDANEYGGVQTLAALTNKTIATSGSTLFDFVTDFDSAKGDIWAKVDVGNNDTWVKVIPRAYVTAASYSFPIDGNFTERYTIAADQQYWAINKTDIGVVESVAHGATASPLLTTTATAGVTVHRVISVSKIDDDGVVTALPFDADPTKTDSNPYWDASAQTFAYDADDELLPDFVEGDKLQVRFIGEHATALPGAVTWDADDTSAAALRKGYAKVYLLKDVSWDPNSTTPGRPITSCSPVSLSGAQNVTIDVTLDREELNELGRSTSYARPLQLPMNVSVSLELTQRDFELYARLANTTTDAYYLSPDQFVNILGLRVKLFSVKDPISDTENLIKTFDIPKMTPESEAWNMGLQGSATQTYQFRAHDLLVQYK